MKILLVEDDETIAFGIYSAFARKGYEVICCSDMAEGKAKFSREISLILLDLNLPDGSGYDFCRWVRKEFNTPIIFLTVRDDVEDITRGLDMGADDYITKPFHIAVLESRIQAVLRRRPISTPEVNAAGIGLAKGHILESSAMLVCGNIRLNTEKMQVCVEEEEVALTGLEYRLLRMLMENKGCILPRNRILERLWDADGNFVNDNTLTVAMKRLRKKLRHTSNITTVRGIGYRMEEKE